jgi:hypothetical protein
MGRRNVKEGSTMKVCRLIVDGGKFKKRIKQCEEMKEIKEKIPLNLKYDKINFMEEKKCQKD